MVDLLEQLPGVACSLTLIGESQASEALPSTFSCVITGTVGQEVLPSFEPRPSVQMGVQTQVCPMQCVKWVSPTAESAPPPPIWCIHSCLDAQKWFLRWVCGGRWRKLLFPLPKCVPQRCVSSAGPAGHMAVACSCNAIQAGGWPAACPPCQCQGTCFLPQPESALALSQPGRGGQQTLTLER